MLNDYLDSSQPLPLICPCPLLQYAVRNALFIPTPIMCGVMPSLLEDECDIYTLVPREANQPVTAVVDESDGIGS